jgi:hypothetical protein
MFTKAINDVVPYMLLAAIMIAPNAFPQNKFTVPAGKTITLKSKSTNLYVTAWGFEPCVDVRASAFNIEIRSEFDVVDVGKGLIALRSHSNNTFWTARGAEPDVKIVSSSPDTSSWTKFSFIKNSDGTVSFRAPNARYLSVIETDTTITPVIDSALVRYSENLKKSPGYDPDHSSRPIITPEMQKPVQYKAFYLRARSMKIGTKEKFEMAVINNNGGGK